MKIYCKLNKYNIYQKFNINDYKRRQLRKIINKKYIGFSGKSGTRIRNSKSKKNREAKLFQKINNHFASIKKK
jgi:hypothetical protein